MKRENIWIAVATLTVIGGAVLILASCDDRPAQQVAYVPQQPQQVVAVQPQDHFWEDMFIYHMIFGGNQTTVVHQYSRPVYAAPQRPTTVINNTTIVNHAAPVYRTPATVVSRPTPSYTPPRVTSYSGSYSPRPSYSSYSSRSSYSSFSGRR
jgi:hypothetical protein